MIQFSIVAGGPLHRLLRALRLVSPGRFHATRPALAMIALTWLPLMEIVLVTSAKSTPILRDWSMHARLLVAIPLFFAAESALEFHADLALRRFAANELAPAEALRQVIARAERLRDLILPELIILLLAVGGGVAVIAGWVTPIAAAKETFEDNLSSPSWLWYRLVALPMYQFLLGRWLWRWAIWSLALFWISRSKLRLTPTHPDQAGGISHLAVPLIAYGVVVAGASAGVAAEWFLQIELGHARARDFLVSFGVLLGLVELVGLGPLVVFTLPLIRARRDGKTHYDLLGRHLTLAFERRWVENDGGEVILDKSDVSVLTDYMSSYDGMSKMRLVPFGVASMIGLAIAMALPMVPVLTTELPLPELITTLFKWLMG